MPKLSLNASRKTKHTPAGEIPVDWGCVKLGSLSKVFSGGTPSRKNPDFWNGQIPWIKTGQINNGRIYEAEEYITEKGLKRSSAKLTPAGTILIALYGQGKTRGQVGLLCIDAAINQACAAIVPNEPLDVHFLLNFLKAKYHQIRNLSNTGNQENLNADIVKSINVPLPPLSEQEKIADILNAWNISLEKLDALIQAKQQQKKALMQQLLTGKRRLPGFEGDWDYCKFDRVFKRITRKANGSTDRVLSITAGTGFVDHKSKWSRDMAGRNLENYILLRRGEFAYNKGNSDRYPQGCVYRLEEFEEGAVPNVWFSFRLNRKGCDPNFYKHFFLAGGLNHQLSRVINSGVRNDGLLNLTAGNFFSISVPVPGEKEQQTIGEIMETSTNEIKLLTDKRDLLDHQKRGLMQQLLTGKTRV